MPIPKTEYHPFYQTYIDKVDANKSLTENLQASLNRFFSVLGEITENQANYRYAKDKWSIKELVQHLIDTERVMSYRALAISRKEKTNLPGFDENKYIKNANVQQTEFVPLLKEFSLLRKANIAMFSNFNEAMLQEIGTANNAKISTRAIGFIMSGHVLHHLQVVQNRYL